VRQLVRRQPPEEVQNDDLRSETYFGTDSAEGISALTAAEPGRSMRFNILQG
jgi:hypothetical protein